MTKVSRSGGSRGSGIASVLPGKAAIVRSRQDQESIRESLAIELFGACTAALLQYQFSRQKLRVLAEKAVTDGPGQRQPVAAAVLADMGCLGELAGRWAQDPSYLDPDGRPRVLDIRGRNGSLQTLVREFFGRRPVDEVIAMGCNTRVMQRVGENRVAYCGGCVLFAEDPLLTLAHSVRSTRWFLATCLHNHRRCRNRDAVLPERAAYAIVSREDLPIFKKFMRRQVSSLIEMGDRWLTARAGVRRRQSAKKITLGIQAFVFQDRARPRRRIP